MSNRLIQLELFHLRLPFQGRFSSVAAPRSGTNTVVAAALLADGTVGFGEGVPQRRLTGETVDSVFFNISDTLAGSLAKLEPKSFAEMLERADNLPFINEQGHTINTARCCVELALLDAYGRYFNCGLSSVAGWLGFGPFISRAASLGSGLMDQTRVSGLLGSTNPARMASNLRLMRWYGLRDFKLKVGGEYDHDNLKILTRRLGNALRAGQVTLRVDANGAWDIDAAMGMSEILGDLQVCCLEQPLAVNDRSHMSVLADLGRIPIIADESLVSVNDGEYLAQNDLVDLFNIRISKNGGLLASMRLAELACKYSRGLVLGAMMGESAILAAAGRHFLQMVPDVRFTEISYGTFLLKDDLSVRKIRFGYGGKLAPLTRPGLGVEIRRDKIGKLLVEPPRKLNLA